MEQKGIKGSEIREAMVKDLPWEHMVPLSVAEMLKKWDIHSRLER
jgi:nicotinamide-nucleotide adenylyltransferase